MTKTNAEKPTGTVWFKVKAYEVEDLHQKYPQLSHEEIKDAIRAAGPAGKT